MKNSPVPYTCPDIDKLIKRIDTAISEASQGLDMEDPADIKATFKEIIHQLQHSDYVLEELRESNSKLRDWGEEQYSKVLEMEDTIDDLRDQLNSLWQS